MSRLRVAALIIPSLALGIAAGPPTPALDPAQAPREVPKKVLDIQGTYTGSWTLYGLDEAGEPVKRSAWTDTVIADRPKVEGDRAFVSTVDEMTFEGVKAPPFKMEGREGYLLKKDGSLGDYFIEFGGSVKQMIKLDDETLTYVAAAAGPELVQLGFPSGAKGRHVLVKVITSEAGVETHRISRVTTVQWKDSAGKDQCRQYVSLKGFHKKRNE